MKLNWIYVQGENYEKWNASEYVNHIGKIHFSIIKKRNFFNEQIYKVRIEVISDSNSRTKSVFDNNGVTYDSFEAAEIWIKTKYNKSLDVLKKIVNELEELI